MFFSAAKTENLTENWQKISLGAQHYFFSEKTFVKEKKKNFYFVEGLVLPTEKTLFPKETLLSFVERVEMECEKKVLKEIIKFFDGEYSFFVVSKQDAKVWGYSYGKSVFYNENNISSHSGFLESETKSKEKTIVTPGISKPVFINSKKDFTTFIPDCIFAQGRSLEIATMAQILFERESKKKIQVLPFSFYRKSSFKKSLILANIEEVISPKSKEDLVLQPSVSSDTKDNLNYYFLQMQETLSALGVKVCFDDSVSQKEKESVFCLNLKKERKRIFLGSNEYYPISNLIAYSDRILTGSLTTSYLLGELKHGPMAMMDSSVDIFAIVPFSDEIEKHMVSLKEIEARKANVTIFTDEKGLETINKHCFEKVLVKGSFIYNTWRLCHSLFLKMVV